MFYGQNYTSDHTKMTEKSRSHAINNVIFRRSVTASKHNIRRKVWWQTIWERLPVPSLTSYSQIMAKNIQCTTEGVQHPESLQCSASCNLTLILQKYRHKSHDNLQKRLRAPSHSKLNASECSQQLWNIF